MKIMNQQSQQVMTRNLKASHQHTSSLDALAPELDRANRRSGRFEQQGLVGAGIVPNEAIVDARIQRARQTPVKDVTWAQLNELTRASPQDAQQKWQELEHLATTEIRSGNRAARVVEGLNASPVERARFLALRRDLAADWQPRGGVEEMLIDQLAQAQTLYEHWLHILNQYTSMQFRRLEAEAAEIEAPRLSEQQAIEVAENMVERWHRICMRVLRNLRDLRRYPVIVQAGQVNIAEEQQVNLNKLS